jgi:hypothetical protein
MTNLSSGEDQFAGRVVENSKQWQKPVPEGEEGGKLFMKVLKSLNVLSRTRGGTSLLRGEGTGPKFAADAHR